MTSTSSGEAAGPHADALDRLGRGRALLLSALLVLVVALCDYLVGTEISFSIFYLLPISVASWHVGRWEGYVVSLVSAFAWLANDLWIGEHAYSEAWIPYWNASMRLMIFVAVGTLLAHWKTALGVQRQAFLELDRTRREQLQLKDQLLSHVSHELRTPLTAAQQFVTLVLDGIAGPVNERQREFLEIAHRNVKQLGRMIGDLLESTRSDSGKLSLQIERVRVDDLLAELVRTVRSPASERGVDLALETDRPLPEVLGDAGRIRQVVTNLLDNALKFTPPGGRVTVRATRGGGDGFVRVSVEDTGRGIAPEAQKRLFQRLFQAEAADAASRNGLGLGLYISREIVLRQGGRIWVDSRPGVGSTFHFTIPVVPEEN